MELPGCLRWKENDNRLMASDRVDTVRRLADAVNRGDRKTAFACMAPDVIWNATGELIDQKLHYNGREEVWEYLRSLDASFERLRVDLDSVGRWVPWPSPG